MTTAKNTEEVNMCKYYLRESMDITSFNTSASGWGRSFESFSGLANRSSGTASLIRSLSSRSCSRNYTITMDVILRSIQ